MMQEIPVIDLYKQYLSIQAELDLALTDILKRGSFILGEEVSAFEREFSAYCGVSHAVGVASGTEALQLALLACGIGMNDEVIAPAHTAVATIAAIEASGARPLLVDIDPATYTLDTSQLEKIITPSTRAIIPVHLYGYPVDMKPVLEIARERNIFIVEDGSQAHGAKYAGARVGSFGDIAAFSFYPTKNLGAFGDAGVIVTNHDTLAEKARLLRQYGWKEHYISSVKGMNSRLDEIQAGILRVKLRYLDSWNERRRQLAAQFMVLLSDTEITLPAIPGDGEHVFHQFVIRSAKRDGLRAYLKQHGIHTLIHYPVPVHLQPAYADLGYALHDLPNTELASREVLSLPIYPELTEDMVHQICQRIAEFQSLT
jgi:dTDP-3-amino-3,4,6-trideoxy-alpha-D-glucose transaminase